MLRRAMKPSNESKGGLRGSVSSGIKRLWRSIPAARPKGDAPPPADEEAPAARAGAPTPRAEPENVEPPPKEAFERAAERVAREARSAAEAEDAKAERTRQRVERKRARNRKRPPGGGEDAAALRAAKELLDGGDVEAARRAFKDLRDRGVRAASAGLVECARRRRSGDATPRGAETPREAPRVQATPRERPRSSSGSPGRDIPEVVARAKAKGDEWFREEKLEDAKVAYGAALEHLSRVGTLSAGDVEDEAKRTLRGVLLANRAACDCQAARAAAAAGQTAAARAAYERVVRDCGEAVACSPRPYARAHLRRSSARLALGDCAGAADDAAAAARAASCEEPEDSAASRRDSKTRRDAEARDAAAAHDDCGALKSLLVGLRLACRPLGDGSSSPLVDVAAVAAAARAVAAKAPCAALGGLADACAALERGAAEAALEALDDALSGRGAGAGGGGSGAPPGGAPPNRAALFALKCRAGLSLAADDGAKLGARGRHRAVIAAKTDLALGRNALGPRPAAGDAAALDRLAKRAALLAAALDAKATPARLAELADALEGLRRAQGRDEAAGLPSWARDASAVREEATEVDLALRERDALAARLARGAAERPPPPPPHQPGPPPMPPPPNFEAAMPPPPPKARPAPAPRDPAAAFARFEKKLEAAAEGALRLGDLPLPRRSGSVSGASRADPVDDRKRAVRAALLRWHPDKFDLSKFHPDDRDAVSDAVAEVTRRIVKEKKFLA